MNEVNLLFDKLMLCKRTGRSGVNLPPNLDHFWHVQFNKDSTPRGSLGSDKEDETPGGTLILCASTIGLVPTSRKGVVRSSLGAIREGPKDNPSLGANFIFSNPNNWRVENTKRYLALEKKLSVWKPRVFSKFFFFQALVFEKKNFSNLPTWSLQPLLSPPSWMKTSRVGGHGVVSTRLYLAPKLLKG